MNQISEEMIKFKESILSFHLPRWEELPDIELYMDQVITFIENSFSIFIDDIDEKIITPSMVNNYVKLSLIPKPVKKRYNKTHLAYLIAISILKHVFTIQQVRDGIVFQAKLKGEKHAYNSFCEEQENALKSLINQISPNHESTTQQGDMDANDVIIKMGTLAFASKIITAKMIELQRENFLKNDNN